VLRGAGVGVEGIVETKVFTRANGLTGEVRVGALMTEAVVGATERVVPSGTGEIGASFLGWVVSGISA
jgi:hypothetical protein